MSPPIAETAQNDDLELAIYNLEQARHCSVTNGKRGLMIVSELLASAIAKSKGWLFSNLKMAHNQIQNLLRRADSNWDLVRQTMLYIKAWLQSIQSFDLNMPELVALARA